MHSYADCFFVYFICFIAKMLIFCEISMFVHTNPQHGDTSYDKLWSIKFIFVSFVGSVVRIFHEKGIIKLHDCIFIRFRVKS